MAVKIFTFIFALLAVLLMVQNANGEENKPNYDQDVLYIEKPYTVPRIISPSEAMGEVRGGVSNKRVCTVGWCRATCISLGFRSGHCNANRICVCSR